MRKSIIAALLALSLAVGASTTAFAQPEFSEPDGQLSAPAAGEQPEETPQEEEEQQEPTFTCGDFVYVKEGYVNCRIVGYTGEGGDVEIPTHLDDKLVIFIGDEAFKDQTSITSVKLPTSLYFVGDRAFMGCTGISRVLVPKYVRSIGEKAFGFTDEETLTEGFVLEGIEKSVSQTYCEESGVTYERHLHDFSPGIMILHSTCTKLGILEHTCEACGETFRTDITKSAHRFTVTLKTVAPTETSEGYTLCKCKYCDATKKTNIVPKIVSIKNAKILGVRMSYTYTGKEIKPVPTVEVNGVRLERGVDFKYSFSGNINVGTGKVTVSGMGKYSGSASKTFKIAAADIKGASSSGIKETYKYTGEARKPKPTLIYSGKTLVLDKDYTLSWSNNTEIGTATITITGKGNFTGKKTLTFRIVRRGWFNKDGRTYYYNTNGDIVKNSLETIDGSEYYFDSNGWMAVSWQSVNGQYMFFGRLDGKRVVGNTVDSIYIAANGSVDTSGYNGTKINTMMTAHKFVEQICEPTDSMETKRLKCFKWLFQFPYHRFRLLSDKYWLPGWENDFANDIFVRKAGCCVSEAAACAFMFHEIGYEDVYIAHDTGHAWVYMNGRVYDPLFAEAKDFNSNYDVVIPYGVYRHSAVDMRKI